MLSDIKTELKPLKKQKLFLALMIVCILRKTLFNRARDMDAYSSVDASASVAILMTIILGALLLTKMGKIKQEIRYNSPFLLYYYFAAISVLWAGWQSLAVAGYKAVEVIVSFFAVIYIMHCIKTIKERFSFVIVSLTFCNVVYLIMFLRSGLGHDNAFPLLAITEMLLLLGGVRYKLFQGKHVKHHFVVSALTIILGTSTASWMSLIIGLFFFFSTSRKGINLGLALVVAVAFYGAYQLWGDIIYSIVFGHKSQEMIESGSGRRELWEAYIEGWKDSPLVGYGFIVGEKGAIASRYIAFATNTAHNMMISVLVNTGLIGLFIWLYFLWKQCWICWKYSLRKNPYALTCFPAIIAMFVNANSFPVIGSEWSPVSPPIYALIIFIFVYIKKDTINNSSSR